MASISYISSAAGRKSVRTLDMDNVLVMDASSLSGVYVVTDGVHSRKPVASSDTPDGAYNLAIARGVADPVLIYVPTESDKTVLPCQD